MADGEVAGVDLSRKFVSESELDERRKKRQEEWEKVRKPDDPEEAPEEEYDPRCLYDRLQEQKDKKQQEYEEQFKFRNMVRGLDEDETSFLDEVSRQQVLVEKQRRDEEKKELLEYRISFFMGRIGYEPSPFLSFSSSHSSDSGKKQKVDDRRATGDGDRTAEQDGGAAGGRSREAEDHRAVPGLTAKTPPSTRGVLHLPSAAVCVGVLPGLSAYSGSSDSDSSSDSEGSRFLLGFL
uniref:Proteasome activator subunit 3 interacting protein 1 n=1 Tax=Cyprinodon variegatus TaxID=28743 RepID=A0A3Q2D516_CYPVA